MVTVARSRAGSRARPLRHRRATDRGDCIRIAPAPRSNTTASKCVPTGAMPHVARRVSRIALASYSSHAGSGASLSAFLRHRWAIAGFCALTSSQRHAPCCQPCSRVTLAKYACLCVIAGQSPGSALASACGADDSWDSFWTVTFCLPRCALRSTASSPNRMSPRKPTDRDVCYR